MRVLSGIRAHGLSNQAVSDLCLLPYGNWDQVVSYCGLELNVVDYHLSLSVGELVLVEYCANIVTAYHMMWMWLSLFCDRLKILHLFPIYNNIPDYLYTVQHMCAMPVSVVFMFRLKNGFVKAVNCYLLSQESRQL